MRNKFPTCLSEILFPVSLCIRLVHKNDCLDKKLFPLLTHKHRCLTQKCAVCHIFIGRWVKNLHFHFQQPTCFKAAVSHLTFPGGTPSTTSLPPVTRVCSVRSVSGRCTTTNRATNWESSWLILI